uniref:Homeobox protein n=1 Tax=Gongylonema pulchrum TaxID=637853 RepID=A0A183DIB8_9BILA
LTGDFLTSLVGGVPQSNAGASGDNGNGGGGSSGHQGLDAAVASCSKLTSASSTEHIATTPAGILQLSAGGSPTSSNDANCD